MEIQAIAVVSSLFFVIAVWKSLYFPKHLPYCLMNALPLAYSSPSAVVCCCCAVLLLCVRFLKGPYWRNHHHHPWMLRPPCSHAVSGWYSPILTCMRCLGPFRSLLAASKYKKTKSAALLSGAYRLVQGYRPRFLQSLINVYAVYSRDIPWIFARVYCSSAEPFVIKEKKKMRHKFCLLYIFVYLGLKGSHISSEKKTKKNR